LTRITFSKNNDCAICVDHLTKKFRIPQEKKRTVYEHLTGIIGGRYAYKEFFALDDVSFTVKHEETFGIIGPNGSGKSTLLKILAGILYPDEGHALVQGKIAAFIELGVGFQPDLTAKENIYLYGSIMGLKQRQIKDRYSEILTFSELKRFEHMRLKNFSSGMVLRLAFATAIQTDPDILLVDEVLSVGDVSFQEKCAEKITEFRNNGKTIVYVSHSLSSVNELCNRCLLLDKGKPVHLGSASSAVDAYLSLMKEHNSLSG
jgi:lipopolysaccharide transport system ATP-binding protein